MTAPHDLASAKHVSNILRNNLLHALWCDDAPEQTAPRLVKAVEWLLAAFAAGGHVLCLDYNGSGVGYVAHMLANSIATEVNAPDGSLFRRVLCRPDYTLQELLASSSIGTDASPAVVQLPWQFLYLDNVACASPQLRAALDMLVKDHSISALGRIIHTPDVFCIIASQFYRDYETAVLTDKALLDLFHVNLVIAPDMIDARLREHLLHAAPTVQPLQTVTQADVAALRAAVKAVLPPTVRQHAGQLLLRVVQHITEDVRVQLQTAPSVHDIREALDVLAAWLVIADKQVDVCAVDHDTITQLACRAFAHKIQLKSNALDDPETVVKHACEMLVASTSKQAGACKAVLTPSHSMLDDAKSVFRALYDGLTSVVLGMNEEIELLLTALLADGHILFESFPGAGKSFMAKRLGSLIEDDAHEKVIDIEPYHRIQCTPDLLPSDITGYMMLSSGRMVFKHGPIFAYVLLIDEINRTTPKVQSAFLEAMAEKQVTVDDKTYKLGNVFFVIATQNPLDRVGTFELPFAQLDRFLFKRRMLPVTAAQVEADIIRAERGPNADPPQKVPQTMLRKTIMYIINHVQPQPAASGQPDLISVLQSIANAFGERCVNGPFGDQADARIVGDIRLKPGSRPSPRSLQALLRAVKARRFIRFCQSPTDAPPLIASTEDVQAVALDFFRHRVVFDDPDVEASITKREHCINKIIAHGIAKAHEAAARASMK